MCRCFQRDLWDIPTPANEVLDGYEVQTHIKIDALYEQRWLPEQHPRKKSGHMLHLLCPQEPLGTVCLQRNSDHVCFWPLTLRHRQARLLWCHERVDWRVEWRSVVFSNDSRFRLYANDGRKRVRRRTVVVVGFYGCPLFGECCLTNAYSWAAFQTIGNKLSLQLFQKLTKIN